MLAVLGPVCRYDGVLDRRELDKVGADAHCGLDVRVGVRMGVRPYDADLGFSGLDELEQVGGGSGLRGDIGGLGLSGRGVAGSAGLLAAREDRRGEHEEGQKQSQCFLCVHFFCLSDSVTPDGRHPFFAARYPRASRRTGPAGKV